MEYRLHVSTSRHDGSRGAGWPAKKCFDSDPDAIDYFTEFVTKQFLPTANEVKYSIYEGEGKRIVCEFTLTNENPYPRGYKS